METDESDCIEALLRAADELEKSPTKAEYEGLGITPASATIIQTIGSWNEAKSRAGLETFTRAASGGTPVQPKPDWVEIPDDTAWEKLSGQQRWYYKNRDDRIGRKDRRRDRLRRLLYEHKLELCECRRCGESRAPCLDFHHPDEKTETISKMVNDGYSWDNIRDEIDRCTVLCANCHRLEHNDSSFSDEPDNDK